MNSKTRDLVDWLAVAIGLSIAALVRAGVIHRITF